MNTDGSCETCREYKTPDANKYNCITRTDCAPRVPINVEGLCAITGDVCDDYKKLSDDKRSCVDPECEANQIWAKDGTCTDCAAYKISDLSDRKAVCIDPTCDASTKIESAGTCATPTYTTAAGGCLLDGETPSGATTSSVFDPQT
jgi:hypothetical protein